MKKIRFIYFILMLYVFAFGAAEAQLGGAPPMPTIKISEGPTLEATLQWISLKLAEPSNSHFEYHSILGDDTDVFDNKYMIEYKFDDCILSSIKTGRAIGPLLQPQFPGIVYYITTVKLKDLDVSGFGTHKGKYAGVFLNLPTIGEQKVRRAELKLASSFPAGLKFQTELSPEFVNTQLKVLQTSTERFPVGQLRKYIDLVDAPAWYIIRKDDELLQIRVIDEDLSERMVVAFKRAVLLCQQRAAKEIADRPAKPKELF